MADKQTGFHRLSDLLDRKPTVENIDKWDKEAKTLVEALDKATIHRGKYKSLTLQQRRWLKRRQAVEPAIGHLKSDNRMDRCWLQGQLGDALHTVLCAAGYNLRWLLRAMVRLGLKALLLRSLFLALLAEIGRTIRADQLLQATALSFGGITGGVK